MFSFNQKRIIYASAQLILLDILLRNEQTNRTENFLVEERKDLRVD